MGKVKFNGTEIYYEEHGNPDRPAVVLSTPVFLDCTFYRDIAKGLSDEYHVILYDHRGHGQSAPLIKRADIESTTQDAVKLIEHLKIDPCHFVGNGLGAYVGLHLAVRRPDLLQSCILMGALPEGEGPSTIRELDTFFESLKHDGIKTGLQSMLHSYFGESFLTTAHEPEASVREKVIEQLKALTPHQLDNVKQIYHRPEISRAELKSITLPVGIVVGEEDLPSRIATYRRLTECISHSSYRSVPEAGYLISIEKPEAMVEIIKTQIERAMIEIHASQLKKSSSIKLKPKRY